MNIDSSGAAGAVSGSNPRIRATACGAVEGLDDPAVAGVWAWKGIPFAKPPVGPLRWHAPVAPEPWSGIRPAHEFGAGCLQNGRIYGPGLNNRYDDSIAATLNTPVGSEDCLSLNIWRPATSATGLPVLFFIHGGSNVSGYGADPIYDGARLAREAGAVVVTAQYRLGVLGFFRLAELDAGAGPDGESGNFALLDLLAALRFVQANIASFGGDPANVTAMGQSAGALNLVALMASPLAAGLFQKAMPLSGGLSLASNLPAGSLPTLLAPEAYKTQGRALLLNLLMQAGHAADLQQAASFADGQQPAWIADFMRAQDGAVVLRTVISAGLNFSGPVPDGRVLPVDPIAAISAGNYNKVPTVVGVTNDEGKLFAAFLTLFGGPPGFKIDDATRFRLMRDSDPDSPNPPALADLIDAAYLPADTPETGYEARTRRMTDIFLKASGDNLLAALAAQQKADLWHYRFDWAQEPAPWNVIHGAAHLFDIPFVFGNFGPSVYANAIVSKANSGGRLGLSAAMMASVAAFLHRGDPNCPALGLQWQPWPATLVFDASPAAALIRLQPGAGAPTSSAG